MIRAVEIRRSDQPPFLMRQEAVALIKSSVSKIKAG